MAAVADPLGGSYFVETAHRSDGGGGAWPTSTRSTSMGGIVRAIEEGYPQREIANSAYQFQRAGRHAAARHRRRQQVRRRDEGDKIPTLKIEPEVEQQQIAHVTARQGDARPRARPSARSTPCGAPPPATRT